MSYPLSLVWSLYKVYKHTHGAHKFVCPSKNCPSRKLDCSTCNINLAKLDLWDETHRGAALKAKFGERCGRTLLEFLGWRKPLKRPSEGESSSAEAGAPSPQKEPPKNTIIASLMDKQVKKKQNDADEEISIQLFD